jgi:hypothetical protein
MGNNTPGQATILSATLTQHGHFWQAGTYRYDIVLDVRPGGGAAPFRAQLLNQRIYQNAPKAGTVVAVTVRTGTQDVTLIWKGDPNLDLNAWRDQRRALQEQQRLNALNSPPDL